MMDGLILDQGIVMAVMTASWVALNGIDRVVLIVFLLGGLVPSRVDVTGRQCDEDLVACFLWCLVPRLLPGFPSGCRRSVIG